MSGEPRNRWMKWIGPAFAIVLLLVAWDLFAHYAGLDALLVATPLDVARSFADETSLLATNAWTTTQEALFGLLIACAIGVAAGLALHLSAIVRDTTLPLLVGSQAVPIVVIAPLLVIAFGYGIAPKLMIVGIACFFPIAIGTFDGLRSADPELLRLLRSLGSRRLRTLWLAELPAALPRMLGGVKIAATWAYVAAVFAEYAGSTSGLGYVIARGTPSFETARVYAAIVILALASLALYGLVALAERRFVPWERHAAANR